MADQAQVEDDDDMALSRLPGDDEVYVGGILTLRRKAALESIGITHIVSVLRFAWHDYDDWQQYEHLDVPVDDLEHENLLVEFERCGAFIDHALSHGKDGKPGKVLVHCAMGKSRSVAMCIAFLLRRYPTAYTVASALQRVRQCRPMAEPNAEFMAQLELYHEMKCAPDVEEHPVYQRWLYRRQVADALAAGVAPEMIKFEDEINSPRGRRQNGSNCDTEQSSHTAPDIELRCRKCRQRLATSQYMITHESSKSAPPGRKPAPASTPTPATTLHSHHFLHPLSWMRATLSQGLLSGRLECPNARCAAQIGRYAWQGLKCSCGEWVCPAFSLARSRVDEIIVGRREDVASQS